MIRKISAALSFLLLVCVVTPLDNHFFSGILQPVPAFAQSTFVLEEFALYSQKEIKLQNIGESRGNVGTNGSIDIKKGASGSVIGSLQALGDIKNEAVIGIYGDVTARVIEDKGSLSVSGQKIERADLVPLTLPELSFTSAGPDLEVPENSSMTIAPGSYGRLKVKKGAAVILSNGTYYFVKFEIDESAAVNLDVSGGAIQINVTDKIKFKKNVAMQIVGGNSDKVQYNYSGTDKVKVEDHAVLRGILTAPSTKVEFKKGSRLVGAAYADSIQLAKGASFRHYAASEEGRPPTADAGGYQTALAGGQLELDGSGSSDPDGDAITYHWSFVSFPDGSSPTLSDPTDPMPTFAADRIGIYVIQLLVDDGTYTSLRDTATVTVVSGVLEVADFVLYADDKIKMDKISGGVGHVGANRHIHIEKGPSGKIAGDLRVLGHIKNSGEITIAGDVITNSKIDDHGVLTVTGMKIESAVLTPRMLPSLSFSAEGPDLKVPESAFQALAPGSYGRVEVKKRATLQLATGSYFLRELGADDSAILIFDVSEGGIELNVAKKLGFGKDADLQITGGGTRNVLFNYAGKKDVEIEDRGVFRGTLVAPKARVEFEKNSRLEGAVYARKIYLDQGVGFQFHQPLAENNPPVADIQTITTAEDTPAAITLSASDSDGDLLTFSVKSQPLNGTITGAAPNLTYTPDPNFNGTDEFSFTVNDGTVNSDPATVNITVAAVNDVPVANTQSVATDEDTSWAIVLTGADVEGDDLTYELVTLPTHGTLSGVGPDLIYLPDADYNGADSFTFKVNDGQMDSHTATVSITINAINDAPVTVDDAVTTDEDAAMTVAVLANDTDVDGDPLVVASTSQGAHGAVDINPDGTITYTPDTDFNGADSFTYTIDDENGGSDTATVSVIINPVNDIPVAVDDMLATDEDAVLTVAVMANDSDVDGNPLVITNTSQGATGAVSINPDGTITYTPNTDFNGSDCFTYTVDDENGGSDTATVSVTVNPVNDAPAAAAQSVTLDEDTSMTILLTGSDVDADALTYAVVSAPSQGTLEGEAPNLTYVPASDYNGADSFTFKSNDGQVDSQTETVSITINAINDAPVAADDAVTTDEDAALTVAVMANDSEVDGDPIFIANTSQGANGAVSINPDGTITYKPSYDFNGTDSFTYTVEDANGGSDTATVSVTVNPVNDAPIAVADNVTTDEDTALGAIGVLANDTDVDGDTLLLAGFDPASHGTVIDNGNGTYSYTPDPDYHGTDTFTYTISDGQSGTAEANITVTVNPVNDAPVAVDDPLNTDEDAAITVAVLANDSDVDGDSLVITNTSQGANGAVSINPDGTITYTPNTDFNGADSFTYTVDDENGGSDTATVSVTVNPVNDAPAAADQSVALDEDTSMSILLTGSDVDGDTLAYEIVGQPANGTLSGTALDLTYTPYENYNGTDAFSFRVNDGSVDSDPATINIAVAAVNDTPVADAGSDLMIFVGDMVSLNGGGSSDVDGETLSFQWIFLSVPAGSTAALASPSIVDPGFVPDIVGTYAVQLIVNDGTVDSASDTVVITADLRMAVVPDVVGQIQADAEAALIGANLTAGTISPAYSGTVPPGQVINQAPAAGASIVRGSAVDLVVSAGPEPNTPAAYISASPATIQQGESTWLSWSSANVQSAHIDQGIGIVSVADSIEVFPEHTTTYVLSVTGSVGSASAQVTVTVTGNPEPQPVGSFGEQYEDLAPPDATLEFYDPRRFSVITGLVRDLSDLPIADVSVTLFDHPEYGTAKTDTAGRFSLPMDGGATFTLVYQKHGYITSHRKLEIPWNDIAVADTIQMISEDPISTNVIFDGKSDTVVTHRSSPVDDQFGSRSATMVFTGDNRAYALDAQGNTIQELTTITTRATEYPTPESMPAVLPPTSAFTYCVEMSVDGVKRVRFDKPVITWVENFLGFPVGEIVPAGFYDRDRGVWVPLDNGVVVQLLDRDSNGIVDALDATGDGHPNDLDNDGSLSDEVAGLGDPGTYSPGATFWRVEATHFSPKDYNWPLPGQPAGATAPDPQTEPSTDGQKTAGQTCNTNVNSYITQRSRIFHEDIPISGTGLTLHYASNRVKDYHYELTVAASGETIPTILKRIVVVVEVAGRRLSQVLQAEPYQTAVIVWDGLDYLGRPVSGQIDARTSVGFVYDAVYNRASAQSERAFAQPGNTPSTVPAREELTLWRSGKLKIHPAANQANSIAEGWTLSAHHYLSPASPSTLYKGDGTTLQNYPTIITTVTGDGSGGTWGELGGDNGPATEAQLGRPMGLTVDAQGNLYIADSGNHRVRKVDPAGIITTIAGSGPIGLNGGGFSGDGGPATQARLDFPDDVAVDAEGNLFIADSYNHRVRKVDTLGIITTVAGSGLAGRSAGGFGGDNGPAVQARLDSPTGIALDDEGNLYIADTANGRVRKVDPVGIITTIAGSQPWSYGGDGGAAVAAGFDYPFDVAVDASGNLYVVDLWGYRVRKIDAGGIITTVAGTGDAGDSGDGGQAVTADLDEPLRVAVDASGSIYISDSYNGRIRKVDQSGIINTVAGTDSWGYSGDSGPATLAELYSPAGLAVDAAGNLYLTDLDYHFVRKVAPLTAFADYMTDGYLVFAEQDGRGHVITGAGRHTSTIDLQTNLALFDFGYDEHDNLVTITDRFANQVVIERDAEGVPTAIVSPDGQTTELTIDANNHLSRVTHPDGSYYQFEYSPNGLMTAEIEPEGNRFEHVFNSIGRLTDVLDPEGGHWNYLKIANENGETLSQETTGEGNITSYLDSTNAAGAYTSTIADPTGATTLFSQTGDGLTVNKSLPCGMDLEFQYGIDSEFQFQYVKETKQRSPSGLQMATTRNKTYEDTDSDDVPDLITETVAVNGKTTTLETSILEADRTITSPEDRVVTTRYDPQTLLDESVSVTGLFDTTYAYDTRGRLTSATTNTRQTTLVYDTEGFLESVTDPGNQITTYSYDPVGRVNGISRPDGGFVGFTYDKNGNMTVLTNPVDVDHGFGFNGVNRNSAYQTPLSGSYSYIYDKDRRLIQTDFPSGNIIFNDYTDPDNPDDKSRLWRTETPEGSIDFTYLCGTKVGSITKDTESITYDYDGQLVTSETLAGTLNQSIGYTYNNDFGVAGFTYAGGTVTYSYDNDGLLTGAGSFTIARNADNGLPEAVAGGALNLGRTFNGYGEVDSQNFTVGSQNVLSWSLTRDNNGRITQKTETANGVISNYLYTYDSMGRLLTVTKDGMLIEDYKYDISGTRISETNTSRALAGRSFSYSDEDHLLTAGLVTYGYDLDGFLTAKTDGSHITNFTYSSRGELLNVSLPDGRAIEYAHDPQGRRIAKKIDGVTVEKYLWQGLTSLLAIYDGADNLMMRFEYAGGRLPEAANIGGNTYYLTYDQVGSLRLVADSAGNVIMLVTYDSFGNVLSDSNPAFAMPFGFAGGLHDRDTGLVRFGYRDYDPDVGRWTAKDPIFFNGGGTDLFGYVLNDPINAIDPNGLEQYEITRPETHPGGKQHIHWGPKNKPRGGGAINRDGSIRHGQDPPRKVKKMIKRKFGWRLRGVQPLFIFQWQIDYFNYLDQGYPQNLDYYYLDDDGRLVFRGNPCS